MTANTSVEKSDPTVLLVIQNFSEKKNHLKDIFLGRLNIF